VAQLFAALASDTFELPRFLLFLALVIIFLIVVASVLMLGELTPWLLLTTLSATPPKLTSVFGPVQSTAPVEVVFFVKLFAAILTHLDSVIDFAFPQLQLDDPLAHLLPFRDKSFDLFFIPRPIIDQHFGVFSENRYFLLRLERCLLARLNIGLHFLLQIYPGLKLLSGVIPVQILFLDNPILFMFDIGALSLERVDQVLVLVDFHLILILKIFSIRDLAHALKDHIQLTLNKFSLNLTKFFVLMQLKYRVGLHVA